jgi:signal peptidase II
LQEGGRAPLEVNVSGPGARSSARRILILTAAGVVLLDQVTKAIAVVWLGSGRAVLAVGRVFDLQLTRNPGGAFGILPSSPLVFFLATAVIVGGVLVWGLRSGQAPVPLGLVAGGGLGNLIDRVVRAPGGLQGRVIDFVHFHFWPTFNLADSAIVVGVGLLILFELRPPRR